MLLGSSSLLAQSFSQLFVLSRSYHPASPPPPPHRRPPLPLSLYPPNPFLNHIPGDVVFFLSLTLFNLPLNVKRRASYLRNMPGAVRLLHIWVGLIFRRFDLRKGLHVTVREEILMMCICFIARFDRPAVRSIV